MTEVASRESPSTASCDGISLGMILRDVDNFTEEEVYMNLSTYWDLRGSNQSATKIFASLLAHISEMSSLKALAKQLHFEPKHGIKQLSAWSLAERATDLSFKPCQGAARDMAYSPQVKKCVLDPQRLSKRVQMKLRSRLSLSLEQHLITLISDSIHERMNGFVNKLVDVAHARARLVINSGQFDGRNIRPSKPKDEIREINTVILQRASLRFEQERQKLLQLGEQSNKRKSRGNVEVDEDLLIRAEKAVEQEEERKLADAANEATRSALGDAKYLNWFIHRPQESENQALTVRRMQETLQKDHGFADRKQVVEVLDTSKGYQGNVLCVDVVTVFKSEKLLHSMLPKLFDKISSSSFTRASW